MKKEEIRIEGMSCQHCVAAVKKELTALPGVASAEVRIGAAVVTFDESKSGADDLRNAIRAAGYTPA